MSTPNWSLRPATYDDAPALVSIVVEATKHQGLWPDFTDAEDQEWRDGFVDWTRESIDGTDQLDVIMIDGEPIGRLQAERDELEIEGAHVPRVRSAGCNCGRHTNDRASARRSSDCSRPRASLLRV